jgi:hypothetical protein
VLPTRSFHPTSFLLSNKNRTTKRSPTNPSDRTNLTSSYSHRQTMVSNILASPLKMLRSRRSTAPASQQIQHQTSQATASPPSRLPTQTHLTHRLSNSSKPTNICPPTIVPSLTAPTQTRPSPSHRKATTAAAPSAMATSIASLHSRTIQHSFASKARKARGPPHQKIMLVDQVHSPDIRGALAKVPHISVGLSNILYRIHIHGA